MKSAGEGADEAAIVAYATQRFTPGAVGAGLIEAYRSVLP